MSRSLPKTSIRFLSGFLVLDPGPAYLTPGQEKSEIQDAMVFAKAIVGLPADAWVPEYGEGSVPRVAILCAANYAGAQGTMEYISGHLYLHCNICKYNNIL